MSDEATKPPPEPNGYLVLKLKAGEGLLLSNGIEVCVSRIAGKHASIAVKVPRDIRITPTYRKPKARP